MGFGKWRAAVGAVIIACGMMTLVSFGSAQTRHRDLGYDVFRALGAGSEIGVSVRELTKAEVSRAGLELPAPRTTRARLGITATPLTNQLAECFGVKEGVVVSAVEEGSPSAVAIRTAAEAKP